jgi:hypothetical protein
LRSADAYFNINAFRVGKGIILNLSKAQADILVNDLRAEVGSYNYKTNNCGGPVQNALYSLGIISGKEGIVPSYIMMQLSKSPYAIGQTFHRIDPNSTSIRSPWGNIYAP